VPSAGGGNSSLQVPSASGATGSGASGSGPGASGARSKSAQTPAQKRRAKRQSARKHERRLRRDVARYRGCLGSLPEGQRRVLELRGGTDGPPQSRRETAEQLNISTRETAKREHRGLRGLRACGSSGSGSASGGGGSAASLAANGAPELQPAVMLAGAPALRKTADLREGDQGVLGESASGGSSSGGDTRRQYASIVPGTSLQPVAGDAGSAPLIWIPILLLVALMTAGLIASRRRSHREPAVAAASIAPAVVAPERSTAPTAEPEPEPETEAVTEEEPVEAPAAPQADWEWPAPAPQHPENPMHSDAAHRIAERAKRPAAAAAAGLVGVLVREFFKRRR
jgi:hypothetical protein